jgi:tetratricopeptide (TPR) repeat protein
LIKHIFTIKKIFAGWISVTALLIFLCVGIAGAEETQPDIEQEIGALPALEMAERALVDTLYYNFDPWFHRFKRRIKQLEAGPQTIANQLELMRFYFYMAGMEGELTHVLSFTSKFNIQEIKKDFLYYSDKAKTLAEVLLKNPELSKEDYADAYFFLGASEGYMALLEYGEGELLAALMDGLSADNHFEDALRLDPGHADAHVGLGIYRYGNTRLGGLGNFIMQGGSDLRLVGLRHIETALEKEILSRPLAIKTLAWFYISEQLNPDNADLADTNPLSSYVARSRALFLLDRYESLYFKNPPPGFIGNKGLAMMKGIQRVIDENYSEALEQFEKNLEICDYLIRVKKFKLNPQYVDTIKAAARFCRLMIAAEADAGIPNAKSCTKVNEQIDFIEGGGSMIEYESSKIRGEIQDVFYHRLKKLSSRLDC